MILGAHRWKNNAALMADVARLGYLDGVVLDPTYGRGNWWKTYTPTRLIAHDLKVDGIDFRQLPEPDASIDVVAFDPPYIAQGGRDTSTVGNGNDDAFIDRYGLRAAPTTTDAVTALIAAGITEFRRVLKPRGLLLLKCMNYVNSGRYRTAAYDVLDEARTRGFELVDELIHLRTPGPQPRRDGQLHARRNYSHLFVLRRDSNVAAAQLDFTEMVG